MLAWPWPPVSDLSDLKKSSLSLFLVPVQFRENCCYSCSRHWLLPSFFLSSCMKQNKWKSCPWEVGKTDEQDFKICDPSIQSWHFKSNPLPFVITLIIIIVTPSIIFWSLRHPIQIAFAGDALGHIRKEQYLSVYTHKYIIISPRGNCSSTPSWDKPFPDVHLLC